LTLLKIDTTHKSLTPNIERFGSGLNDSDIYSGKEVISFNNRHPIFRTLMKLEFEEVLRKYHKLNIIK